MCILNAYELRHAKGGGVLTIIASDYHDSEQSRIQPVCEPVQYNYTHCFVFVDSLWSILDVSEQQSF